MKMIYGIEVSGLCNRYCPYCPYPSSTREKGLMSIDTFNISIDLVKKLNQNWILLHNFGEPLLNPKLIEFIKIARNYVDKVAISTNGILLSRDYAISLKKAGLTGLCISVYDLRVAIKAINNCRGLGILKWVRILFNHTWANTSEQKPYFSYFFDIIPKPKECIFKRNDWTVILWDGRISSCCIDMDGNGIIGSIYDKNPLELHSISFSLCKYCHKPNPPFLIW
jgi:hypothetical protein